MKKFKIYRICYSPGYCDMMGGGHGIYIDRDDSGKIIYTSRDREDHASPESITTYDVPPEALSQLEEFIQKNRVLSLAKRPASDLFITDYSPWSISIDYEKATFGKVRRYYLNIGEYKKYSERDNRTINELIRRITSLRGEKLSETKGKIEK